MKSTVEHIGPTRVRFNVEVPFDELKPDFDRAYKKIAKQVTIPGFRPGKAPARLIDARLGRSVVLDEVLNAVVPVKYTEALTATEGIKPIGRPDIEVTELADGEKVAFTAEVDVRPEITLPALDSITVTVDDVEVTDEQVAEQLENLRARFGTLTGVERPAADGDFVQIDLSATVDGEPVEEARTTGYSYQVGEGGLIDGIDEAVTGLSAGESGTFTSRLVAGEYADRDAEITVQVGAVKERRLPEADDEFAQLASEFDTLDELVTDLRERLGRSRRMEQVNQARDKVLEALVDACEVPLPESIVDDEVETRQHDAVHSFDHDDEKFGEFLASQDKTREEFESETRAASEHSIKTRLVLDALADAEKVEVGHEEMMEQIVFQAQQYGMAPEEFVQRIQQANQFGAVFSDVRRSKALIAAVRAATITDADGEPVDLSDLLGPEPEETAEAEAAEAAEAADAAETAEPAENAETAETAETSEEASGSDAEETASAKS